MRQITVVVGSADPAAARANVAEVVTCRISSFSSARLDVQHGSPDHAEEAVFRAKCYFHRYKPQVTRLAYASVLPAVAIWPFRAGT